MQAVATFEDGHEELRDGKGVTIDACYQCHPPEDLGVSHPVGVGPGGKTKIPDDLPTLEGGIITCFTCHNVHGSSRRYFARKKITKDVCISCHEGY
jgi:predicted CXXCH cytochrome family protein